MKNIKFNTPLLNKIKAEILAKTNNGKNIINHLIGDDWEDGIEKVYTGEMIGNYKATITVTDFEFLITGQHLEYPNEKFSGSPIDLFAFDYGMNEIGALAYINSGLNLGIEEAEELFNIYGEGVSMGGWLKTKEAEKSTFLGLDTYRDLLGEEWEVGLVYSYEIEEGVGDFIYKVLPVTNDNPYHIIKVTHMTIEDGLVENFLDPVQFQVFFDDRPNERKKVSEYYGDNLSKEGLNQRK